MDKLLNMIPAALGATIWVIAFYLGRKAGIKEEQKNQHIKWLEQREKEARNRRAMEMMSKI